MGSRSRRLPDTMASQLRPVRNVPLQTELVRTHSRRFVIAWVFALIFYFLEYAVRSSPSVMIPQLATSFGTTALGVGSILFYYYTYSITSLVAGAALDHLGAKWPVAVGVLILAVGCLLFGFPAVIAGEAGRLLQGAGSAFAFTGAVYLAARGLPMSPVRNCPSRNACAVSSGLFQYSRMTFAPLATSSPCCPASTSFPNSSRTRRSTPGQVRPQDMSLLSVCSWFCRPVRKPVSVDP
jgi:hypothetical protein